MGTLRGADVRRMMCISRNTMARYVKAGKLVPISKMSNGLYLYDEDEVYRFMGATLPDSAVNVIYARVGSTKHREDLQDQIRRATNFATANGMTVGKTYFDMARSLDFSRANRRGLYELIHDVAKKKVRTVIVESPDRIAQIGHEVFQMLLSNYHVKLVYMSTEPVNIEYADEAVREMKMVINSMKNKLGATRPKTT